MRFVKFTMLVEKYQDLPNLKKSSAKTRHSFIYWSSCVPLLISICCISNHNKCKKEVKIRIHHYVISYLLFDATRAFLVRYMLKNLEPTPCHF